MTSCIALGVLCLVAVSCTVRGGTIDQNNNEIDVKNSRQIDTKGMLSSLASNIMSRGYLTSAPGNGASQVISLNLTNLLVLILLKALIFAAGSLGAGHWKGGFARTVDGEEKLITEEEILMFLSYLTGAPGDNGCLQNIACQQPEQAKKYIAAGDMLLKTAKMFSLQPDQSYQYVLQEVEAAANVGVNGGNCRMFGCNVVDKEKS